MRCSKTQKPSDKDIGIQQQITKIVQSYPNPQIIVGLALTTSSPINMIENKNNDKSGLVTDIAIFVRILLLLSRLKGMQMMPDFN